MSGPHADQPVKMAPDEMEHWLTVYRAHPRTIEGKCGCRVEGCDVGFNARTHLWAAGVNPDWPNR